MAVLAVLCLVVTFMILYCPSQCLQRFTPNFYLANNRALLNHAFQWKTVSSPVICGRDCSMDPQCVSFNYHTSNHTCELNHATRAHSPVEFIELQGSAYYDDNLDTHSFSIPDTVHYSSCQMLLRAGHLDNGIYTIFPAGLTNGIQVYCQMDTNGGGWIVFQHRQDGSVDFYRDWADYQSGFGNLSGEFWLGNDILRILTESGQWQLRVDMEDWQTNKVWAAYSQFAILGDKYTLNYGLYDVDSTAGDDSLASHNGYQFTTKDQDNDIKDGSNCAVEREGAWWFKSCFNAHLNAKYYHQGDVATGLGIQWYYWKNTPYSLKKCSMKMREVLNPN